jgi:hypothetical protein
MTVHIMDRYSVVSTNNAAATLGKALDPEFSIDTPPADVVQIVLQHFGDLGLQCSSAAHPDSISHEQISIFGFLRKLDPVTHEQLLYDLSVKYPNGKITNLNKVIEAYQVYHRNVNTDLLKIKVEESIAHQAAKDEKKLIALIASMPPERLALLASKAPLFQALLAMEKSKSVPKAGATTRCACGTLFPTNGTNALCKTCWTGAPGLAIRATRPSKPGKKSTVVVGDAKAPKADDVVYLSLASHDHLLRLRCDL